jgi:Abnormal spindle-like microcephaly-assoc'd, ASPM-SPD-2-Hydin
MVAFGLAVLVSVPGCLEPSSVRTPELKVDPPTTVYFPRVIAGTQDRAPLVLHNVGRAPLSVSALTFAKSESPFAIEEDLSFPLSIEPGEKIVLTVLYTPTVGAGGDLDQDQLTIESDDPLSARAQWVVDIRSSNTGPVISILPAEIDFSLVEGHRGPVTAIIVNSGTEPTTVESVFLEGGSEFELHFDTSVLPRSLEPGESFDLTVECTTVDASDFATTTGIASLVAQPVDPSHQGGQATLYGPPVADAGDPINTTPLAPQPTWLNGRGSRSLGNSITRYDWTLVTWPAGSEDASAFNAGAAQTPVYEDAPTCPPGQNTVPEPCFIPDVPGVYVFELKAADVRPACDLMNVGESGCSEDADCCSFSCTTTTCDGSTVDGVCREGGGCSIESVNVSTVTLQAFGEGIIVYLEWDGTGDFDVHLVDDYGGRCGTSSADLHLDQSCRDDGDCLSTDTCQTTGRRQWRGAGDCYWNTAQPDWGVPRIDNGVSCVTGFDCVEFTQYPDCVGSPGVCTNTLDDPRLLKDEHTAFGPEIIKLRQPIHTPGPVNVYHIGAHYFPDPIYFQSRIATVYVYYEGIEVFAEGLPGIRLTQTMDNTGGQSNFWYVGWLEVTPGGATLKSANLQLFDTRSPPTGDGWPALQDPP